MTQKSRLEATGNHRFQEGADHHNEIDVKHKNDIINQMSIKNY